MTSLASFAPLASARAAPLAGRIRVPGDKSISHRALIFGALAVGETTISGLLEGEDVLHTAAALRSFGATLERRGPGAWSVHGCGVGGLREPDSVLDLGNAGTATRLLMGLAAGHPFVTVFTGDASLRRRPMARVIEPLQRMGASFTTRSGQRLPLAVSGTGTPLPIEYRLPVASAQVKSAVLLAGLQAPGQTTVLEPEPTRDHTESLLRHFGAEVTVESLGDGGRAIRLTGQPELLPAAVQVPGDPSSAAFVLAAAALVPGSEVVVEAVGCNPLRAGFFECLNEMGALLKLENRRDAGGELVADLRVSAGPLRGIEVPPERAPSMIDEYPVLAVLAASAEGRTVMRGIGELRVKESDRLSAVATGLAACGVIVEELADGLIVHGRGSEVAGGGRIATHLDHRIAMAFLVLGMASAEPVVVDDGRMIDTSFPGFAALMNGLGGRIQPAA